MEEKTIETFTKFEYRDLELTLEEEVGMDYSNKIFTKEDSITPLEVIVSITVQNVGNCDGAETIQIYVKNPKSSIARAVYEIESYLKVGEEKTIEIRLPKEAFGLYQKEKKCFVTEEGIFEIQIGTAIDDICLQEEFELEHGYAYLTL